MRWCTEPDGSDAYLVFQLRPGAYNTENLIEFLEVLRQDEEQRSVHLIWDGLPSHRSRCGQEWVSRQDRLIVERLPGYAPELNPTEQAWGQSQIPGTGNLCADTIETVAHHATNGFSASTTTLRCASASLPHAGLPL